MKKEDLIHLREQLNKALTAFEDSNLCEGISCTDCVFNMKLGCKTQDADNLIINFLNMIENAISEVEVKKCHECGHELKGDE